MISFASDYAEGAHPLILERIARHNFDKMPGYGTDIFCESARKKIRDACSCDHAEIFFLVGGTQANQMVIDSLLPPMRESSPPRQATSPCTKQAP